ncbi:hypothetical protein [Yoonia sp. SS1-5]|uniref:Uncharacterized protein n=1 Tax=Yoonia rhodophyticola TaxID=3137370 RepID=A0AAN0NIJ7_9RHOB
MFVFNTETVPLHDETTLDVSGLALSLGQDVIADFDVGQDKQNLRDVAGVTDMRDPDLEVTQQGADTVVKIDNSSILLEDVVATDLTIANFLTDRRVVMEYGEVTINGDFVTVDLETDFENPVVLTFINGIAQDGVIDTRIRNVESDSFEIRLQSVDDQAALLEKMVDFVVVEAGVYQLENGAVIEAGLVSTDKVYQSTLREGFESVELRADFNGDAPASFTSVNTVNGGDFVTARADDITADSFELALAEAEANTDGHVVEDIAFLAIEQGAVGDFTTDTLFVNSDRLALEADVDLIQISELRGADTAVIRHDTATGEIFVQEGTTFDHETGHASDGISMLDLRSMKASCSA